MRLGLRRRAEGPERTHTTQQKGSRRALPCSNCHSAGRSLRTKLPVLGDLSTRAPSVRRPFPALVLCIFFHDKKIRSTWVSVAQAADWQPLNKKKKERSLNGWRSMAFVNLTAGHLFILKPHWRRMRKTAPPARPENGPTAVKAPTTAAKVAAASATTRQPTRQPASQPASTCQCCGCCAPLLASC